MMLPVLAQGMVLISLSDYPRATALIDEALPLLREHGEHHGVGWSLGSLGLIAHLQGDHPQAAAYLEESLAVFLELGDKVGSSYQMACLADVARDRGEYDRARHLYGESLSLYRSLMDKGGFAAVFEGLATVAAAEGQQLRAARLFGAAHYLREVIAKPVGQVQWASYDRTMAGVRAALGEEAFAAAWTAGEAMGVEEAIAYALQETGPA
jgi:tetratricopeptide (TPR) repeat protein